jgi:hypothetical protein
VTRILAKRVRDERAEAGTCINGVAMPARGRRCLRCYLVHRHGAESAKRTPEYLAAPLCNPHAPPRRVSHS